MKSVCLAILNYNGRRHLEHVLPTAVTAARAYAGKCSVVVLDNRSTEDDVNWIRGSHPEVRCAVAPKNDFLFSYNWLMPQLLEQVVVILNNDLRLDEHFVAPLLRHFSAPDVFAVSASSYDWDGTERTIGPARIRFCDGFYGWYYEPARQELCHTLFASGGFMAVDRAKFLELGGFNELFYPAYCEDLDLCFRAWRRGWRSIYEPASVVWHREQASWKLSPNGEPNTLNLRNSLLFQWSSLPMERGRSSRVRTVTKLLLGELIQGRRTWWRVYPRALRDWGKMRAGYAALKVSQSELDAIRRVVDAPIPPHGL